MIKPVSFLILFISLQYNTGSLAAQSSSANDSIPDPHTLRPINYFKQDSRWNTASADLFTYWIDNGLFGFYGPQPNILIDGIPVDANFWGWQNLNMLPISNQSEVRSGLSPLVFNQILSPAGYFNFKSRPLKSGFSVNTSYYVGNETGDPGPYVYDSLQTTPNIDRWGPDGQIELAYKAGHWYSRGRFIFHNHLPTDLTSNARLHFTSSLLGTNQPYVNHRVFSYARSALLETGYETDNWAMSGRAMYGNSKDYIFLQPFGREVPAKAGYKQIAVQGHYNVGRWDFIGRYTGHQKTMDKRITLHPYIFDWDQRKHTFALSTDYSSDSFSITPGVTYDRIKTFAPGINQAYNDLILFSLKTRLAISEHSSVEASMSADYNEEETAKTYKIKFPTEITNSWKIKPQIISTQLLPIRQNAFSYWLNRGYTFAGELEIPYSSPLNIASNELTILKLQNDFAISSDLSLSLEQQFVNHRTLNIPFQEVESYEFVTDTQPGSFSITQSKGSRLGIFTSINHAFKNIFKHSLSLNIQRTLEGSARYENYFRQVPETKVQYQLDVQPAPSLLLSLSALYRSSTTWSEFEAIEGNQYRLPSGIPIRDVTGTFHIKTPAFTNLSVSVQKWFWKRRLHTQFSLNNVLNNELRMHPLGADLNTKFDIEISLNL